jgi:2,3-bisphosphoglycerate-dependent phosphoglycerate mutase
VPSTLILLRHGESTWNRENRFTGWTDVPLSETGIAEAHTAGQLLREAGMKPAIAHTSLLIRAISTLNIALDDMGRSWIPVRRSWRLNERHYGDLQGLNKKETSDKFGTEQVFAWRRSYDTPPPALELTDERHPVNDERYATLPPDVLPATECLKDVVVRMMPYWFDAIVPDLAAHGSVIIAAHGNSLRALVKHLDGISDEDIAELNIPTGIPLVYKLDDDFRKVSAKYLGDPEAAAAAAAAVAKQAG